MYSFEEKKSPDKSALLPASGRLVAASKYMILNIANRSQHWYRGPPISLYGSYVISQNYCICTGIETIALDFSKNTLCRR